MGKFIKKNFINYFHSQTSLTSHDQSYQRVYHREKRRYGAPCRQFSKSPSLPHLYPKSNAPHPVVVKTNQIINTHKTFFWGEWKINKIFESFAIIHISEFNYFKIFTHSKSLCDP